LAALLSFFPTPGAVAHKAVAKQQLPLPLSEWQSGVNVTNAKLLPCRDTLHGCKMRLTCHPQHIWKYRKGDDYACIKERETECVKIPSRGKKEL
jgi:hypothetical protein